MKVTTAVLALTSVLLTAAPVMAGNPADPVAPGSDKSVGVAPSGDAQASPTTDTPKSTGAANPDTPDPTKNTPGAEAKN
jgi:hypothetical protein